MLKGTNIGFRFLDDSILFYNKEYQNKTEPVEPQESRKELYVKGKVTDENAEAIIGATVSVKEQLLVQSPISMVSIPSKCLMEALFAIHTWATVKKASWRKKRQ